MKAVLQEITDAMRLAGISFTLKVAKKIAKRSEINRGFDYNNDDELTPSSSSASGSQKLETNSSGSHQLDKHALRSHRLKNTHNSSLDSGGSQKIDNVDSCQQKVENPPSTSV